MWKTKNPRLHEILWGLTGGPKVKKIVTILLRRLQNFTKCCNFDQNFPKIVQQQLVLMNLLAFFWTFHLTGENIVLNLMRQNFGF